MRKITIDSRTAGRRADVVVAEAYPSYARSALHKLFENDLVLIDTKPVKPGFKVRSGEVLYIDDTPLNTEPAGIQLPIIYEDDDVIVINKPAGILTHSKGAYNDEATVASFIRPMIHKSLRSNRAGIVHRLDRATSGVIITAKHEAAMSWLQKQFAQRRTKKTYAAIVSGQVEPQEAIIDVPLERNPKNPKTFRAGANGKSAQTAYKVLKQTETHALVELTPVTGRTHQLRVHLQYLHHPIVGDGLYGGEAADRLFLHAKELEITLPNHTRRVYTAPVPQAFSDLMKG